MSLSNSRLSYTDCFDLLDKALDEPRGIRVEVVDQDAAIYLRMRMHQARTIDRQENAKTYAADHPLCGRSPYDILVVRIEEGQGSAWVYLDKQKVEIGRIEAIPEGYQIEAPVKVLQIEGPKDFARNEILDDLQFIAEPKPKITYKPMNMLPPSRPQVRRR